MRREKKKKSNRRGFTLIELMISMAMIAILSAAVLQIARFSETQKNLTLATSELKSAVRMGQSYALSIPNSVDDQHICGFGVRIESNNTYSIFYTYLRESTFRSNSDLCDNANNQSWSPTGGAIMQRIESFNISAGGVSVGSVNADVFFKSPYGDPVSSARFTISSGGVSKNINISSSGQVN